MSSLREIILPEAKPGFEWILGRPVQKVSPQREHALAQMRFAAALDAWTSSGHYGEVGTEWEFRVQPPGEERRPLMPDVAFLAFGHVPYEDEEAVSIPWIAPDAVVEVLSPGDRAADVAEKIRVYLAAGTAVVFIVDTAKRQVIAHDRSGIQSWTENDTIAHEALPGFSMAARRLFERPRPL